MLDRKLKPCDEEIWEWIQKNYDNKKVFVNVPHHPEYKDFKHTIWAVLKFVGLVPVFASELDKGDAIRLCKLCQLMQTCYKAITDISYEYLHNMPFELGLMVGLGIQATPFILTDKRYIKGTRNKKFDVQLSNLKGVEVIIYDNNQETLIRGLLSRINEEFGEINLEKGKMNVYVKQILKMAASAARAFEKKSTSYGEVEAAVKKLPRFDEVK